MLKEEIRQSLNALKDIRGALVKIGITDKTNPALYINEIVESEDSFTAQSLIDAEIQLIAEQDANAHIEARKKAYSKIDSELMEALVEKEQGNDSKWQTYLTKRAAIKVQHPKPE